jgi:Family of unknown function (DUF6084)
MPELSFSVESAHAVPFAAAPTIALKLRITSADPAETIHTVVLRAQIQIEVARRRYTAAEQAQMLELFGDPDRWSQTLRSMLWTHASVVVPSFTGSTEVDLLIPCTFDFNVAATKYFHGLESGEIPLLLLFSGTVFYPDSEDALRVAPIAWDKETKFRVPVEVWRSMMDLYYPNSVLLSIPKDMFERLHRYKMTHAAGTWERAFEMMLAESGQAVLQ